MNFPHGSYVIIRTDGSEEIIKEQPSLPKIQQQIEAQVCDFVTLSWNSAKQPDIIMIVDDLGWETNMVDHGNGNFEMVPLTPKKAINHKATELYHSICIPGTTHQIVGNVALVHDNDFLEKE